MNRGEERVFNLPVLILVEGAEDQRFIQALLKDIGLEQCAVRPAGGKAAIRAFLKEAALTETFRNNVTAVAIIRDADDDVASAFQSARDAFRLCGLPVPEAHAAFAAGPFSQQTVHTGVFVTPDGLGPGALEDLCLRAVRDAQHTDCVDAYFACLYGSPREAGVSENRYNKQRLCVHLASSPAHDPVRLGEAAEKGLIPLDHAVFGGIRQFLRDLRRSAISS